MGINHWVFDIAYGLDDDGDGTTLHCDEFGITSPHKVVEPCAWYSWTDEVDEELITPLIEDLETSS